MRMQVQNATEKSLTISSGGRTGVTISTCLMKSRRDDEIGRELELPLPNFHGWGQLSLAVTRIKLLD